MEKKIEKNVSKVYSIITGGIYTDADTAPAWVIDEFNDLYGTPAKLAYDLRDKMDELFDQCDTVDDCKDVLENYFYDVWA